MTKRNLKRNIDGHSVDKKIDYKTITEVSVTVISIILMKVGNSYMGMAILLSTVLYDIIIIRRNCRKRRKGK